MAYVITAPCIGVKDAACVGACPADCIHEGPDQMFINPEDCIDCGQCVDHCPVDAIFYEDDVPEQWKSFVAKNAAYAEKFAEQ